MYKIIPELEAKVVNLIAEGRKLEAVKLIKDNTELDLKESKECVDAIELIPKKPSSIPSNLHNEVVALVKQNKVLQAVKLIVESTDLDLRESKEYIDFIRFEPKKKPPISSELQSKAIELVQQDKILEAIKLITTNTNLGLKEAKEYVDILRPKR